MMITSKFIPKTFVLMLLIAVPLFISCKDETKSEEPTEVVQEETSVEQKKQMLNNAVPTNNADAASGNANLNPPHGQPGHRCDIAVGAPLNGTPSNNSPTQINLQNEANATPATGEGLNPPHGQPGHRCDIKVGDPL